jgi:ATP-dependent exoDNAse (exonuclease V) alpha subunit
MVLGHYRLETKIIGRKTKDKNGQAIPGKQTSVVAKAAYRSGQALRDDRVGQTFNYRSRTQEVAYSEIMSPANAPDWLKGNVPESNAGTRKQRDVREQLWATIERVEKRKDSQLAREFIASLPRGLNREQQIELVRGWCRSEFTDKGLVVDLAVHKSKGGKNPHAHILTTMRPITPDGFGKKPDMTGKFNGRGAAGIGAKSDLDNWRESWEKHVNSALEKAGREERVDRRSLKDRGVDRAPEPKIGVAATAMKRRGIDGDPRRFQEVRWTKTLNAARPFIRVITKGEGMPVVGNGPTWWERSYSVAMRVAKELADTVRGTWRMMLDAQRHKDDLDGPRL